MEWDWVLIDIIWVLVSVLEARLTPIIVQLCEPIYFLGIIWFLSFVTKKKKKILNNKALNSTLS